MWRRLIDLDHANHARLPLYQCPATVGVAQSRWPGDGRALVLTLTAVARPPSGARLTLMSTGTIRVGSRRSPQNPPLPPIRGADPPPAGAVSWIRDGAREL